MPKHFFLSSLLTSFTSSAAERNERMNPLTLKRVLGVSFTLFSVFALVSFISLFVGPGGIGIQASLKSLLTGWPEVPSLPHTEKTILLSIRLPRILFAGIVGACLAVAGVIFQGLLRNPLADPYVLGISGGAAVGAIIAIITGAHLLPLGIPGMAFAGALVTIILVFGIARTKKEIHSTTLLLAGVIVNAFFSAVILFLISTASEKNLHSVMFWLMGDLSIAVWGDIVLTGVFLAAGFITMYLFSRDLNLIVTGEETALQLGVNVEMTKKILLVAASIVTGVAVSTSGIIGFIGLIIPHMMRMLLGSDHRLLLPSSALFGGSFLIVADTISRTITAPAELPVGVITALCGAPYFIYLLRRKAT